MATSILAQRLITHRALLRALPLRKFPSAMRLSMNIPGSTTEHDIYTDLGDTDDYDHRILQTFEHDKDVDDSLETRAAETQDGDTDDWDRPAPSQAPPPSSENMGAMNDFDRRKLHEQPVTPAPIESLPDVDDYDRRIKWALGNLTINDILEEKKLEQSTKKMEDEIRLHAWG